MKQVPSKPVRVAPNFTARWHRRIKSMVLRAILIAAPAYTFCAASEYEVIDLGLLPRSNYSTATGLNDLNQVVGYCLIASERENLAFLWEQDKPLRYLGPFQAEDINNSSQVVGRAGWLFYQFAYCDSRTGTIIFDKLPGSDNSYGESISNNGYSVGHSSRMLPWGDLFAFKALAWTERQGASNLAEDMKFAGERSTAYGVNDLNQVVGVLRNGGITDIAFAFRFSQNEGIVDLSYYSPTVRASASNALAINNKGSSVGVADSRPFQNDGGFSYFLGPDTIEGTATAINDRGIVVGYARGKTLGSNDFAFVNSEQGFRDLNELIPVDSGWRLLSASDVNNHGWICGRGLLNDQERAFLLKKQPQIVIPDHPKPEQSEYSNLPSISKDNIIIVTHGWAGPHGSLMDPSMLYPWVDDMVNAIQNHLDNPDAWEVAPWYWRKASQVPLQSVLYEAEIQGRKLGEGLLNAGWSRIHLIGHSAGCKLIDSALKYIREKEGGPTDPFPTVRRFIQTTFLDAYTGIFDEYESRYGDGADWSDNYFAQDFTTYATQGALKHSHNVDVTMLDDTVSACRSTHEWPHEFYLATILGIQTEAGGYGFNRAIAQRGFDMSLERGATPVALGPACTLEEYTFPNRSVNLSIGINMSSLPRVTSATGVISLDSSSVTMETRSPVWFAALATLPSVANVLRLNVDFVAPVRADGLLTVYFDGVPIGKIDERYHSQGESVAVFDLPTIYPPGQYSLAFRLDPFSTIHSSVRIEDVRFGHVEMSRDDSQQAGILEFAVLSESPQDCEITWIGSSTRMYQIARSEDLAHWEPRSDRIPGTGLAQRVLIKGGAVGSRVYYRLEEQE